MAGDRDSLQMERTGSGLRRGWTTGTCAQAAAKAAARILLAGRGAAGQMQEVAVRLPGGRILTLPVESVQVLASGASGEPLTVRCGVRKESGDDPDVTDGVTVYAAVSFQQAGGITVDGGEGVGRVTKPGLDQPVGSAAINRVPREMICRELAELLDEAGCGRGLAVLVEIPGGEELAKRTFNPRIGIEGGLSVLGTTGIVEPMSEQALIDTIGVEIRVRLAQGHRILLAVPGNYGLDFLREQWGILPEEAITCSNYIGETIDMAARYGAEGILFAGHMGKLVKLAGGIMNTHSRQADCRMELLAAAALRAGLSRETAAGLLGCNTTEDALDKLTDTERKAVTGQLLAKIKEHLDLRCGSAPGGKLRAGAVLFSSVRGMLGMTKGAEALLGEARREAARDPD